MVSTDGYEAGMSSDYVQRSLAALENAKGAYAEELSQLKALNDSIVDKCPPAQDSLIDAKVGKSEPSHDLALVRNLVNEREAFVNEILEQKARCAEMQRELERAHAEKMEAQICVNVLNDTIRAALQGEKVLVEQNQRLVSDQKQLVLKLETLTKVQIPVSQSQYKEIERTCSSGTIQEEVVRILYNKACARGLWLCFELLLFCHAMVWILLRILKERHSFVPT